MFLCHFSFSYSNGLGFRKGSYGDIFFTLPDYPALVTLAGVAPIGSQRNREEGVVSICIVPHFQSVGVYFHWLNFCSLSHISIWFFGLSLQGGLSFHS